MSRVSADGRLLDGDDGLSVGNLAANAFAIDDGSGFALSFIAPDGGRIMRITDAGVVVPGMEGILLVERPVGDPYAQLRNLWLLGAEPGEAWLAFEWSVTLRSARWVW